MARSLSGCKQIAGSYKHYKSGVLHRFCWSVDGWSIDHMYDGCHAQSHKSSGVLGRHLDSYK
jgi:hypothetical protein